MHRLALLLLLLAAPATAQDLAAARPVAIVDGDMIRVSDLFENAGARGETVLGAAPAPGRRLVLEAPQLAAIARMHGVVWRPLSTNERVVVERPGRPVPRDELLEALRVELLSLGLDSTSELEIPGLVPPMVPVRAFVQIAYEGSHFDPATQRFAATLVVMAEGISTLRTRLAGRALPTVPVVTAQRRLLLGEVIGANDVQLVRLRAERVRPGSAAALEDVVGKQLRRPIGSGIALMVADLGAPNLVGRNEPVMLVLESAGLALTVSGRSLESAAMGETVPVMNLSSRVIVEGRVVGPGRVRITPGAVPLQRAAPPHLAGLNR